MPLPVFGQRRIDVQEDLRAVPPEVAEQGVFRAGEHTEARQQDGAPSEKVGQRREVVSVRSFFQRAGDDKRVEAGRGEIGFDQRVAVTAENLAERAEKGRPERSHFAFRIQHVLGREPLREAFLQQIREPHPPREKSRVVGFGELHTQLSVRFRQFADAAGEQGNLIQFSGLSAEFLVLFLAERGHQFPFREHAREEAGFGHIRRVAEALSQVTAGAVMHEDHHRVAGLAACGLHHPVFEGVQKVGVPRDDTERRGGGHSFT